MKVTIRPSEIKGTVQAPPSKSWAHRLLICAGLAEGTSVISGLAYSEDILATCDCLEALGANVSRGDGRVTVIGAGRITRSGENKVLRCRESGSTLRFFIPIAALSEGETVLAGSGRLLTRPLSVYEDIFREQGLPLSNDGEAVRLSGPLRGGEFTVDGDISSQFISGLLFALPMADENSLLRLRPPVESRAYIDITVSALEMFGINVYWEDEYTLRIPGRQTYAARDAAAEGDWSNAAFLLAMGAEVTGLNESSLQSDRVCREYFAALDSGRAVLDISGCPDLGPVLMAYAAARHGCVLTGAGRLRIKESDRGEAMKEELAKFGAEVSICGDEISVGCGIRTPDAPLHGHNDHRIVMALSTLCVLTGGTIEDAGAVRKSYPDYFEVFGSLGGDCLCQKM